MTGWAYLLLTIGIQIFVDRESFLVTDITTDVYILRGIQVLQVLDIVLILLGQSKGNIIASFFQILGRNTVTLIFVTT